MFLKISQYPHEKHENICVRVSLEWSFRAESLQLYSKETPTQVFFLVNVSKILKTPFYSTFPVAASEQTKNHFLPLDQIRPKKIRKIYSAIENNLIEMQKQSPWGLSVKKMFLKIS